MFRIVFACLLAAGLAGCAEKKAPEVAQEAPPPPAAPLPAHAAPVCVKPTEKAAFDVASLKSELMVTAISCQSQDKYNVFVKRFRPDLQGNEKALNGYFNRSYGRRGIQERDDYITALANALSQDGLRSGTNFCERNIGLFDEVLALKGGRELPTYASSKTLFQPLTITDCPATQANISPSKKKKK